MLVESENVRDVNSMHEFNKGGYGVASPYLEWASNGGSISITNHYDVYSINLS